MEKNYLSRSKEETIELGNYIAKYLFSGSVLTLTGDLGAGKTTFTKGIGKGLGIDTEINSPTFNICKCYFHKPLSLYHIDAYRLEDVKPENKNIGLEEYIEGDGVCIIEWPIFIKEFIDFNETLNINIHLEKDDIRSISITSTNDKYKELFIKLGEFKYE